METRAVFLTHNYQQMHQIDACTLGRSRSYLSFNSGAAIIQEWTCGYVLLTCSTQSRSLCISINYLQKYWAIAQRLYHFLKSRLFQHAMAFQIVWCHFTQ